MSNLDTKQRENDIPQSLGDTIPAEQPPRGGGVRSSRGVSLRGGGRLSALGELRRAVGGRGESRRGLGVKAWAPGPPVSPVLWCLQVTVPLGPLCQRSGGTPTACQALC